jgi:hypothetical protein
MSRGQCRFLNSEVSRAVRAVEKAGKTVKRVEIDPVTGKITLLFGSPDGEVTNGASLTEEIGRWSP